MVAPSPSRGAEDFKERSGTRKKPSQASLLSRVDLDRAWTGVKDTHVLQYYYLFLGFGSGHAFSSLGAVFAQGQKVKSFGFQSKSQFRARGLGSNKVGHSGLRIALQGQGTAPRGARHPRDATAILPARGLRTETECQAAGAHRDAAQSLLARSAVRVCRWHADA